MRLRVLVLHDEEESKSFTSMHSYVSKVQGYPTVWCSRFHVTPVLTRSNGLWTLKGLHSTVKSSRRSPFTSSLILPSTSSRSYRTKTPNPISSSNQSSTVQWPSCTKTLSFCRSYLYTTEERGPRSTWNSSPRPRFYRFVSSSSPVSSRSVSCLRRKSPSSRTPETSQGIRPESRTLLASGVVASDVHKYHH